MTLNAILASADSDTGFGTVVGTIVILALIAASIVIFRMMGGSLKRMNANVAEHPENFGKTDEPDEESAEQ